MLCTNTLIRSLFAGVLLLQLTCSAQGADSWTDATIDAEYPTVSVSNASKSMLGGRRDNPVDLIGVGGLVAHPWSLIKPFFTVVASLPGAAGLFCDDSAADVCLDFETPAGGIVTTGSAEILPSGGKPFQGADGGYLSVTDASHGNRGAVLFPEMGGVRFVIAGRTWAATSNHHIDNVELSFAGDEFWFSADLRVGGGTSLPGDGFSFNWARPEDPVFAEPLGNGYAASSVGEANLPEEGTTTGLAIGFDEWYSFGTPECTPGVGDCIGFSVRIDDELKEEYPVPTLHGALHDVTSLQTGPNTGDIADLGWAELQIHVQEIGPNGDFSDARVGINWKGVSIPEPAPMLYGGVLLFASLCCKRFRGGRIGACLDTSHPEGTTKPDV